MVNCGIIIYVKRILDRKHGDFVYEKGDLIIYGRQGVCRVEDIGAIGFGKNPSDKLYYTLNPLYVDGTTYAPVDSPIYMRHLISNVEIDDLLNRFPEINEDVIGNKTSKEAASYYKEMISEYTCEGLLLLLSNINSKQEQLSLINKSLSQTEQNYKKEAQDFLYQEFAASLNIPKENVEDYIREHIK